MIRGVYQDNNCEEGEDLKQFVRTLRKKIAKKYLEKIAERREIERR